MSMILKLIESGQSYWLDNLSRGMIKSGELRRRVNEEGLRGITSNPKIFDSAISGSKDYDDQIRELVEQKKNIDEIYEALAVKDVQDACDVLAPVFEESDGIDGFVSLEVSPYLAFDPEATMQEVRRLHQAVGRPNVFIKIPGTGACVPAIEQMLYEGIPINITLLFSIQSYEEVAWAYIRALERRRAEDKPIDRISSVASFFLSRIDVLVDQLLGQRIVPSQNESGEVRPEYLLGQAAIASAKLAYQKFKEIFGGSRWQQLAQHGARVQRPLWASTSTKNPLYRDVRYIEPLIGEQTVTTMPEETITAFSDHGFVDQNTIVADVDKAKRVFIDLEKAGIDMAVVSMRLVDEGVQKFIDPYDDLMGTLSATRAEILADSQSKQSIHYGDQESRVVSAYDELDGEQFSRRIFAKDPYLWTTENKHATMIRERLGWLDSIQTFLQEANEIEKFAAQIHRSHFEHVVLLGMGGSSLCAEVCRDILAGEQGRPAFYVLDNTDPAAIRAIEDKIELPHTLFIVASKSGTTTETMSFFRYFYDRVRKQSPNEPGDAFVAITDPGTPLAEDARKKKFLSLFENPEDIGGRYSALSYFGLIPMALMGIDIVKILESARDMSIACGPFVPAKSNPGISLGTLLGLSHRIGRDLITFTFSESLKPLGKWLEQLLAESTGKDDHGLLPIVDETLEAVNVYGDDRLFVHLYAKYEQDKETSERLLELNRAGHPVVEIELNEKEAIGGEFFRWEMAVATAGAIMGINPFDEPNVLESKRNTSELLRAGVQDGVTDERKIAEQDEIAVFTGSQIREALGEQDTPDSLPKCLQRFAELAEQTDYIAVLPYFHRTAKRDQALRRMLSKLQHQNGLKHAGLLHYGPRYLHSTGQLFKGGLNTGLFVILTAEPEADIAIPEQDHGFATLQRAQALGDYQALLNRGRRVLRIHLEKNIDDSLARLAEAL